MAGALEAKSKHPIARAILRRAKADGILLPEVEDFRSITGQGPQGEPRRLRPLPGAKGAP